MDRNEPFETRAGLRGERLQRADAIGELGRRGALLRLDREQAGADAGVRTIGAVGVPEQFLGAGDGDRSAALDGNAAGDGLAISDKGRTAAEMMVFARYVMFGEVYWHHAVRSATCMFARAFFELRERLDLPALLTRTRPPGIARPEDAP